MRIMIGKRLTWAVVLLAFFAATLGPIIPRAGAAEPCAMMMAASTTDDGQSSKGAMPVCGQDISCVVFVALPAPFRPTSTDLVWAPVRYWTDVNALTGLSVPPDISPPIFRV